MKAVSSKGISHDFAIDLDAVLKMEEEDPTFSIVNVGSAISENVRMTDIIKIAKVIGWDYLDFVQEGYTIQDLIEILTGCFEELGFIWDRPEQTS